MQYPREYLKKKKNSITYVSKNINQLCLNTNSGALGKTSNKAKGGHHLSNTTFAFGMSLELVEGKKAESQDGNQT